MDPELQHDLRVIEQRIIGLESRIDDARNLIVSNQAAIIRNQKAIGDAVERLLGGRESS